LPLSEKVRIEIFIPELADPIYSAILEELGNELAYAYGGLTPREESILVAFYPVYHSV